MSSCTGWFDGWPVWLGGVGDEWKHCCDRHDEYYESARTFGEFVGAHAELLQCVASVSWIMASVMFLGVLAGTVVFGVKVLPSWHSNWGRK